MIRKIALGRIELNAHFLVCPPGSNGAFSPHSGI
jgi:hypothetical protein